MSADVSVSHEGVVCSKRCLYAEMNITRNLTRMMRAAGLPYWDEVIGLPGMVYSAMLMEAVQILKDDPELYKSLEPENWWGSYDGLIGSFENFGIATEACLYGTISVGY